MRVVRHGRWREVALAYALLQFVIWAKSAWFFLAYGHGRVMLFNRGAFPSGAVAFDHWFHLVLHLGILALALLFGALLPKWEWKKRLFAMGVAVLVGVVLHNVGYWFTGVFETPLEAVLDFAWDFAALLAVVLLGHGAVRARGLWGARGLRP